MAQIFTTIDAPGVETVAVLTGVAGGVVGAVECRDTEGDPDAEVAGEAEVAGNDEVVEDAEVAGAEPAADPVGVAVPVPNPFVAEPHATSATEAQASAAHATRRRPERRLNSA